MDMRSFIFTFNAGLKYALPQYRKLVFQKQGFTQLALDLSAGSLRQAACFYQNDSESLELVVFENGFPDRFNDFIKVAFKLALDLANDDHSFVPIPFQTECCASIPTQGRMRFFDTFFDVLRIVISSSNDNAVFQSSGNKQFTAINKTEIARSQEWP